MRDKFFKKKILVAGGTGLIGQQITRQLIDLGAEVSVCSLDKEQLAPKGIKDYFKLDMTIKENCKKVCDGMNIVFSLLGATGSPATNTNQPATFMMGNLLTALNILNNIDIKKYKSDSTKTYHFLAESLRRGHNNRSHFVGDPDYFDVPISELLSAKRTKELITSIDSNKASSIDQIIPYTLRKESKDT